MAEHTGYDKKLTGIGESFSFLVIDTYKKAGWTEDHTRAKLN
jgi:hypothetical protein